MQSPALLIALLFSGFSGLAYELIWVRLLALSFGTTTLSFSTVLAVFFGGLAGGALVGGRMLKRIKNPIRAYAIIEIATGVSALLLFPLLKAQGQFFASIDPGHGLGGLVVRLLCATILLGIPTVLMGATLPVVTSAMVVRDDRVGSTTALIYGFNTAGAFLGAYGVTYFLLFYFGVFGSTLFAVGANMIAAAIALAVERWPVSAERSAKVTAPPRAAITRPENSPWLVKRARVGIAITFLSGLAAIAFQVVLVRLFSIFLSGTIYGVGSVLIAVLLGIAGGSLLAQGPLRRSRNLGWMLYGLQLGMMAGTIGLAMTFDEIGFTLEGLIEPGLGSLHIQLLVTVLVLALPTFCSGAMLPTLVMLFRQRAEEAGAVLSKIYAANTVGSIIGSLLAGFVLLPISGSPATVLVVLVLTALAASLTAIFFVEARRPLQLGLCALGLIGVAFYDGFDVRALSLKGRHRDLASLRQNQRTIASHLTFFSEGRQANVVAWNVGGTTSLTLNGLGQGGRRSVFPHHIFESLLVGLVPTIHTGNPQRTMVVGLGAGVTVDALLSLTESKIVVIELEPDVPKALPHIFPPKKNPLHSERVELVIGDARHELARNKHQGQEKFDIITSMPAHPWVASSIFTQEFFELARDNLTERGVFSTWFGAARDPTADLALLRAFDRVFPYYVAYFVRRTGAYYLVGSKAPPDLSLDRIRDSFAHTIVGGRPDLTDPFFLFRSLRGSSSEGLPLIEGTPINTDDTPIVELRVSRTSTRAPLLENPFPLPYGLSPDLVAEHGRADFYRRLLETLLGTPSGDLPLAATGALPRLVRKNLELSRPFIGPAWTSYFEGRLALSEGKVTEARESFAQVAQQGEEPEPIRRAAIFSTLTWPRDSPERLAALRNAPQTAGVVAYRIDVGNEEALTSWVPQPNSNPELSRWLHRLKGSMAHVEDLGELFNRTSLTGLLAFTEAALRKNAHPAAAQAIAEQARRARRRRALQVVRLAQRDIAQDRLDEARRKLVQAAAWAPGERRVEALLLETLVRLQDRAGIEDWRQRALLLGQSPYDVEAAITATRNKTAGNTPRKNPPPERKRHTQRLGRTER